MVYIVAINYILKEEDCQVYYHDIKSPHGRDHEDFSTYTCSDVDNSDRKADIEGIVTVLALCPYLSVMLTHYAVGDGKSEALPYYLQKSAGNLYAMFASINSRKYFRRN